MKVYELKVSYKSIKENNSPVQLKNSEEAANFFRSIWPEDMIEKERMYAIFLNSQGIILAYCLLSEGGVCGTILDPRVLFSRALQILTCTRIIIAHNHPSGSLTPSPADIKITDKIKEAGKLLDIEVVDSLILAPDGKFNAI